MHQLPFCLTHQHAVSKTFRGRVIEVIDQAQHFAALGPVGAGGASGDSAQAFREGLDATERDRECCSMRITMNLGRL